MSNSKANCIQEMVMFFISNLKLCKINKNQEMRKQYIINIYLIYSKSGFGIFFFFGGGLNENKSLYLKKQFQMYFEIKCEFYNKA